MKRIYVLLLLIIVSHTSFAQYLLQQYRNQNVFMQIYQNGKLVSGYKTGPAVYQYTANYDTNQTWQLVSTANANWYKIYHVPTGRYITVINAAENADVELRTEEQAASSYQEFQFIQQTNNYRYKIHSRFSSGAYALILEIPDGNSTNDVHLRLGKNITIGDAKHQKFDLTLAAPPVDPSTAIPSLADRFEGRTVGFSMRHNGLVIRNGTNSDKIWMDWAYNVTNFASLFKIEYTTEVGWYKIKYKPTGKYITLVSINDGAEVKLMTDAAYTDDYQKFKFIIQLNDSTYKIHSKFSIGSGPSKRALVLEAPTANTDSIRLKKNITIGTDLNQQFIIRKNVLATPAQFNSGVSTLTSGKIYTKQYHISSQESLAMLEPFVVGKDTFVRIQPNPVYGEKSEWIFSEARKINGVKTFKIRYGATGQYLYLPTATDSAFSNLPYGLKVQLKTHSTDKADRRFEFSFNEKANNWFTMISNVTNGNGNYANSTMTVNDDGYLATPDYSNTLNYYSKSVSFCINLSIPTDASKLYCIYTKNQGHLLSDSGKVNTGISKSVITHIPYIDFSCFWYLIPTGDGVSYYIKNQLSGQFIASYNKTTPGDTVYNSLGNASANTKWIIERRGNFFTLRNNITNGKYLALRNHPDEGKAVVLGVLSDAGTDWTIARADYFDQPLLPATTGNTTLLTPYAPNAVNALTADSIRDKLMKNIGLPFEPALQMSLYQSDTGLIKEGFPSNTAVSFLPVLRSALIYKFSFSTAKADSALRNYKIDEAAHRVQMAYALRSYLLERLPLLNRNIWTQNEKEMVAWLERSILKNKSGYADRLKASWEDFKLQSYSSFSTGGLSFDFIYGVNIPDYRSFKDPEYIQLTEEQSLSLVEYERECRRYGYKNPGPLANVPNVLVSNAASNLASGITFPNEFLARSQVNAALSKTLINNNLIMAQKLIEYSITVGPALRAFAGMINTVSTAGAAAFPVAVVLSAGASIAMASVEVNAFMKFDSSVTRKVTLLKQPVTINTIMTSNNLLNRYNLTRDVDYILGTGTRYDNGLAEMFHFTGNGNWSNASNWLNNRIPPSANFIKPGSSIVIDPITWGECVLDVNYSLPANLPMNVIPNKRFRVKAQLTTNTFISTK